MIEVRKLIPQVYNQSRDFSVFTGLLQVLINELDIKSYKLTKLPIEDILPPGLDQYSGIRKHFRFLLKQKGSIEGLLQAVSLSGGKILKLEEEDDRLNSGSSLNPGVAWDFRSAVRDVDLLEESVKNNLDKLVYYYRKLPVEGARSEAIELTINIEKGSSRVDQSLLNKLLIYIKPVNVILRLKEV